MFCCVVLCCIGLGWKNESCKRKLKSIFIIKYLRFSVAYILKGSEVTVVWGGQSISWSGTTMSLQL